MISTVRSCDPRNLVSPSFEVPREEVRCRGPRSLHASFEDRFERPACHRRHAEPACAPEAPAQAPPQQDLLSQLVQLLSQLLGLGRAETQGCAPSEGPEAASKPDSYGRVPEVDGSAAGWQRAAPMVEARTVGSAENRAAIHLNGQNPWSNADGKMAERVAVWWAMQKNGDVKYDADKKEFFTTRNGGERDATVATLDEVMAAMNAAGGPGPSNGAAYQAVGGFIDEAVRRARA